jgi:murein DD-endopeptidase MepM/ murein hydrolase activator NlpD
MAKRFYTCIIVPHASHRLHKLRIPAQALHVLSVIGVISFFVAVALAFNYIGMAVKVADYEKLLIENGALKAQTLQLKVSAEQLNTKITALENFSKQLSQQLNENDVYGRIAKLNPKAAGGSVENYSTASIVDEGNLPQTLEDLRKRTNNLENDFAWKPKALNDRIATLRAIPSDWPVHGALSSPFGTRLDPFTGDQETHLGLDIIALYGAEVKAPADGTVIYAGLKSDYGNLIIIKHGNGFTTRYGHLKNFSVRQGDKVLKGQIIGHVGLTGRTTGTHLHYEVRQNDQPLNPRKYLAAAK